MSSHQVKNITSEKKVSNLDKDNPTIGFDTNNININKDGEELLKKDGEDDEIKDPQQQLNNNKKPSNVYTQKWIEESEFDDQSSIADSTAYTSSVPDSDCLDNDLSNNFDGIKIVNDFKQKQSNPTTNGPFQPIPAKTIITSSSGDNSDKAMQINQIDIIQKIFNGDRNEQTFGNIDIKNSQHVHFGNITYVTGPIHITHTGGGSIGTINQTRLTNDHSQTTTETNVNYNGEQQQSVYNSGTSKTTTTSSSSTSAPWQRSSNGDNHNEGEETERVEVNKPEIFIGKIGQAIDGRVLKIINRMTWLAQPALDFEPLPVKPVKYVIISHTATESTKTQAETVYLVRNIQTFHIESRNWHDIAYSFLIGGDGNVYEGRGWNNVGAHTYGYNKKSIGISFVGCFMKYLPPDISLSACKLLIKKGIEDGHIAPDYKLLAHCQCSAVESPGKCLFEEIKKWPHWSPILDNDEMP